MFINHGRIMLECSMEDRRRYVEVMVNPDRFAAAQVLAANYERQLFGRSILLFDNVDRRQLAALGDVRTPSMATCSSRSWARRQRSEARGSPPQNSPRPIRETGRKAMNTEPNIANSEATGPGYNPHPWRPRSRSLVCPA